MGSRGETLLITIPFAVGLWFRIIVISQYGFHYDELNKIQAIRSYYNFDFSDNPEHPALLKIFIFLSTSIFGVSEFSVRLPNAIVSAATVYPIYYVGKELYSELVGFFAAWFWATNITVLAFSTIAKEDPLLTLFWTFSIYYFILTRKDPKYYSHLGCSVGLGLASKYTGVMIVFVLLILLYFRYREGTFTITFREYCKPILSQAKSPFFKSFFIANFSIVFPSTIVGIIGYALNKLTDGHNEPPNSEVVESYFGLRLILHVLIKNPLFFLIGLIIGTILAIRVRSYKEKILLVWAYIPLLIYSIFPWSFPRYIHPLEPAFVLLTSFGVAKLVELLFSVNFHLSVPLTKKWQTYCSAIILSLITMSSMSIALESAPFYRMYSNELDPDGTIDDLFFANSNVYDYYLKEAIHYVSYHADVNSTFIIDQVDVGEFYARDDLSILSSEEISILNIEMDKNIQYAIIQDSRTRSYNAEIHNYILENFEPIEVYMINGLIVCEIYNLTTD